MWKLRYLFLFLSFCNNCNSSGTKTKVRLHSSGATFPADLYEACMPVFEYSRRDHSNLDIEFDAVGSSEGIRLMKEGDKTIDYAASDIVFTEEETRSYPDLQMFPTIAGGVVLAYNLPDIESLVLTRHQVVGIYNGSVSWWNDTTLQITNPNVTLPSKEIKVVARADQSGTTEMFTEALSEFSSEWKEKYGTFSEGLDADENVLRWNHNMTLLHGRTNRGMTGIIYSYRYSIGYISVGEAMTTGITYAKMINKQGNTVDVDPNATKRVIESRQVNLNTTTMTLSLSDSNLTDAYPILGFSYFIVNLRNMSICDTAVELIRYVMWLIEDDFAEESSHDLNMTQITTYIVKIIEDNVVKKMTCGAENKNVLDLVVQQLNQEAYEKWYKTWGIPLTVSIPVACILLLSLLTYIVYQQVKFRKAILSDDWKVPFEELSLRWDREKGRLSLRRLGSVNSAALSTLSDISQMGALHIAMVGLWKEKKICLRKFPKKVNSIRFTRRNTKILTLRFKNKIHHNNILKLHGVTFSDESIYLVSEYACKGSLTDVLQNNKYNLDDNIKYSMAIDVTAGMSYLHSQGLVHGQLISECCLLDGRWSVKVSDWEFLKFSEVLQSKKTSKVHPDDTSLENDPQVIARQQFWTAPELLQNHENVPDKKSDVYSLSVIIVEIFTREDPFYEVSDRLKPKEVVDAVAYYQLRPDLDFVLNKDIKHLLPSLWHENPQNRPSMIQTQKALSSTRPSKRSVVECMMETLEGYVLHLEEKVQERTEELGTANQNLENLLHQILPPQVAKSLSRGESVLPEHFDSVTIFFSDIVHFTDLCSKSTPLEVVKMLNDLYTCFDAIIDKLEVYKVETIGDAYMVISGLPTRNGIEHAGNIATMALQLMAASSTFQISHIPGEKLQLRAGIHSGSVVAGVVGTKMPRYCLFGDTVNSASRMESTSLPCKIQISETTMGYLQQIGGYDVEYRGDIDVKGKGTMKTFLLNGKIN